LLAIIILAGLLLLGFTALRDYLRGRMLSYANVEQGFITLTLPAELLVLRNEYVLTAPAAGLFEPQVEEGARVKEGSLLGYCGGKPVLALKGGAVSYQVDGWEEKLRLATLHDLDWQQVFGQLREEQAPGAATAAGDEEAQAARRPLARVVDNLLDYAALLMLQDPRGLLAEESSITFKLPDGYTISAAHQERWQTVTGDVFYIFNKISSKEDILFNLRYSEVEIIAREVGGLTIPSSAITLDNEGKVGVFIRKKRKLVFTEIEELASKDDISVVNGLDETAVVVTNPSRATDGQRI
jgi:putative membrane fusion protein